ncbi:uncharacterized protein [Rutidosis leptorrhynchoides]|uniref:uncharacterized protein n=1 Tax=Rutidosis leptorrhynchoides TaxID=125765 RepID=UPI003A9A3CAE
MKLSHLCFADDLLVLCHGDVDSIKVIDKSLSEFSEFSGLFPSLMKSTIFFGSVPGFIWHEILKIVPFQIGSLPMKYLGVPLLSKRLGISDCKCLVDKIKNRIHCWKTKTLSYAGRLQLISSVLSSMQIYWCSVYLLPKETINDIERMLKNFLWNSGNALKGRAKIAKKMVCKPKDQGGLGIKSLHKWNEVLLIKQFWGWKNLLALRDQVKSHEYWLIGNGRNVSAWFNRWSELGCLADMISKRDLYDSRLSLNLKVADLIFNGQWIWTEEILDRYPALSSLNVPALSDNDDVAVWATSDNKHVHFSTKQAWVDLRDNFPLDKLAKWYPNKQFSCVFCGKQMDSHVHLFFKCEYSHRIWAVLKQKILFRGIGNDLQTVILNIAKYPGLKNIWNVINRVLIAVVVYHIWIERNKRVFRNSRRSSDDICNQVIMYLWMKLISIKLKKTKNVLSAAGVWGLKWNGNSLAM